MYRTIAYQLRYRHWMSLFILSLLGIHAQAQFSQQGGKLVGTEAIGAASQGKSVALSADGNTAIIGGSFDNGQVGAAWIFTRSGTTWSQQTKLIGTGAVGKSSQGYSVAISADGNTAIVGGPDNDGNKGAAWIFVHGNDGSWSQQGDKLIGTGAVGNGYQGNGVAISADGNTAIVGGPRDNTNQGAIWVFIRATDGTWSQQGNKLVGTGAEGTTINKGATVALSADGNTAIVGGGNDNSGKGAVWIFVRATDGTWSQQGNKLIGTEAVGNASQGSSVAISADGNTVLSGGVGDNSYAGAAWVFTRSNNTWTQQGSKLKSGTLATLLISLGSSVALSGNGNIALVGGPLTFDFFGAALYFTRTGSTWQEGSRLMGVGATGNPSQGVSVALSGDGNTALVGGYNDNNSAGAVWVYATPNSTGLPLAVSNLSTVVIGSSNCPGRITFTGSGLRFEVTGPGGYVFNQPFRTAVTNRAITASGIKTVGQYRACAYGNLNQTPYCQVFQVTGQACP